MRSNKKRVIPKFKVYQLSLVRYSLFVLVNTLFDVVDILLGARRVSVFFLTFISHYFNILSSFILIFYLHLF